MVRSDMLTLYLSIPDLTLSALPVPSRAGDPGAGLPFMKELLTDALQIPRKQLHRLNRGNENQSYSITFRSQTRYQIIRCFHWPIPVSLQMSEFSLTSRGQNHEKLLPACTELHFVLIHCPRRDLLKSQFMDSTSWWFPEINEPGFQGMQMSSNLQPASRLPAKVS